VSDGTRPPVSKRFGWPVVSASSIVLQSVMFSQLHDGSVCPRHSSVVTSQKSTAPFPISLLLALAFGPSLARLAFIGASAHGSGLPKELPKNQSAHATITL